MANFNTAPGGLRLYRGRYPSVTTILKVIEDSGPINHWRKRVGDKEADAVLRDAQAFGTALHSIAEKLALGKAQSIPDPMRPYASAARDFLREWVEETVAAELTLISRERNFAGTVDLYCKLKDGSYAVVDLKTTSQLKREHGLQVAAYAILLRDNGHPVHRRLVVRIKKENGAAGKYHVREFKDHREDAEAFLAAKTLFEWKKKNQLAKLLLEAS